MTDILRACEGLALHLFNSVLVIDLLLTSTKQGYVYSLLADILRAGERV